ncbi:MAG TPA: tRNA (5-methylaminomethyl-2-thiouridine)(34)-methyltransferase MnmD, partial [Burkholderiaceae bacterium]
MNTAPIVPATLAFNDDGVPFSPEYQDIYHPQAGALLQARHVFLGGNELPCRWQRRERFVVLEAGFGLGHNFLATWQAWRDDPQRCAQLWFISIEQHPLTHDGLTTAHRDCAMPELAVALHRAWPPLTANLHRLDFDEGRVQLLLALGDVQAWLPELVASVDAFYLDGFAPAINPRMWDERVCKALGRLAAPGATLATWSAAHAVRARLTSAGFKVRLASGTGGKRDITP